LVKNSRTISENRKLNKKQKMLNKITGEQIAKNPFVYMDRQSVTTALTRIKLFEKILEVQGSIVECGVFQANSLFIYAHLSSILEPYNFNRKIIGFDTFEGFRSISDKDPNGINEKDFANTNLDHLKTWAKIFDENRAVSHIPKIELIKGNAINTIPKYVHDNPHLIISLLYLDFDIYEPTSVALKNFLPLVPKGGIIGFDELNSKKWKGETIALKENIVLENIKLKRFYFDPWVSFYEVE